MSGHVVDSIVEAIGFEKRKKYRKRSRTEDDKISKNTEKHRLLPPCNDCDIKCVELIKEERRIAINKEFWCEKQISWLFGTVKTSKPKRPRVETKCERECEITKTYCLLDGNKEKRRVCMKFYLRTLGYTHDTFVKNVFRSFTENTKVLPSPDKRGRHDPPYKLSADDIQSIRNHILSYHPTLSHYRRKHASNRLYLAPELTIAAMHDNYNSSAERKISCYSRYEQEIVKMNVSFVKLGTEECEQCDIQVTFMVIF